MAERVRQNFHPESEAGVNKQINLELYAMYTYLSMGYYFERTDKALPGFAKYFRKAAHEEMEHAEKFMKFQMMRGGKIVLEDIKAPAKQEWGCGRDAMQAALELERTVNDALLKLHKVADGHGDFQMSDFIEGNFLHEQVDAIKELSDHITNLTTRLSDGHGEWHFDKELSD